MLLVLLPWDGDFNSGTWSAFLAPVTLHSGTEFCTFLFIMVDYGGGLISPGVGGVMAYLEERSS